MPDLAPRPLPDTFLFGVATAGFQIEGGYNGPGEPRNNWFRFEVEGRVEPSGLALDFWNDYEAQLDRAVAAGCDAFRFSVEWARCEPADGELDEEAFARYADIADACRERGLTPLVTLHHFTHPRWAGEDFWLGDGAPERFARWASEAAQRLAPLVRHWVTINETNILAIQTYVTGDFPPARTGDIRAAFRCLDHLLAAHVLAYDAIHAAREDAIVSTNGFAFSLYEIDRLGTDILLARRHGVPRAELGTWLAGRRARHRAAMHTLVGPERVMTALMRGVAGPEQLLPRTVDATYRSPARLHARPHPARLLQPGHDLALPTPGAPLLGRPALGGRPGALGRPAGPGALRRVPSHPGRGRPRALGRRERDVQPRASRPLLPAPRRVGPTPLPPGAPAHAHGRPRRRHVDRRLLPLDARRQLRVGFL